MFCGFLFVVNKKNIHTGSAYRYTVLSAFILFGACNSNPQTKPVTIPGEFTVQYLLPPPSPITDAEKEHLRSSCEAWYNTKLKSSRFNGGIVVAKKGNIIFEAYNGTGHPGSTDTITDSTSFHIASVSKTFTAMAVLKLWENGKLNIDDEFSKYFPNFNYPGVTVRTLLDHRSGLPNYVHFMENMGWNKKINITNQDVLDFLITRKAEIQNIGTPDTRFAYCNTNFALLALLIEKVSGKKYGDYLQETFFSPLQMKHTFVYNHADSGKVTMSYDWRGKLIAQSFLDMVYGDKNIYSTPRDLLTWDRALTSGLLFTPKTLEAAYTPYSNERAGIRNYGLGWRMNNYPSGKKMIYHNGWWHGNNAAFIRLLEDSATIIVLGNKYNQGIYHAKDLANIFGNYFGDAGEDESETARIVQSPVKKPAARTVRQKVPTTKKKVIKKSTVKATAKKKPTQPTRRKKH